MVAYLRLDYVLSSTSPPVVDTDWLLSSLDNRVVEPRILATFWAAHYTLTAHFIHPGVLMVAAKPYKTLLGCLPTDECQSDRVWMYPWTTELFYTQKRDRLRRLYNLQSHTDFSSLILYERKNKTPYHSLCSIIFSVGQGQRPKGES